MTTRVPAARGPHPAIAGQRNVVADTPQDHLCGHALVDAIQQFFDEPRTRLRGKQVERRPPLELALGIPKPSPSAIVLAEYFLAQRNDPRDPDHTIRLVTAQGFAPCTPMAQRPPRDDEGVDFLVSQPGLAQSVDGAGRQPILDEFHQILVGTQPLDAEDPLHPLEDTRQFESRGVDRGRFRHHASLLGIIAQYLMASCQRSVKTPGKHLPVRGRARDMRGLSLMAKTATDPIHPGEILLEEFLKSYHPPVSQTDAADRLGWTFVRLNQFVNGKRAVTAVNAIALGELTGTSPELVAKIRESERLRQSVGNLGQPAPRLV